MKRTLFGIGIAAMLIVGMRADAATIDFTYTGGVGATGSIDIAPLGGNQYQITGGSIAVNGYTDTFTLVPGGPLPFYSPSGAFIVDNVYYDPTNPHLDSFGALFRDSATGDEVNLWGNGPDNYTIYVLTSGVGYTTSDVGGTLDVVTVPDGGLTVAMLGFALTGLGLIRRKVS